MFRHATRFATGEQNRFVPIGPAHLSGSDGSTPTNSSSRPGTPNLLPMALIPGRAITIPVEIDATG
jgi:hypothetical protein